MDAFLHLIFAQPEIAPNTGNAIRLAANTGAKLHLVEPLGFAPDDAKLRRAGLDYREWAAIEKHRDIESCLRALGDRRLFATSAGGGRRYDEAGYRFGDAIFFGRESRGLDVDFLARFAPADILRLPMRPGSRSVNLANAAAVFAFEAWRQLRFPGAA